MSISANALHHNGRCEGTRVVVLLSCCIELSSYKNFTATPAGSRVRLLVEGYLSYTAKPGVEDNPLKTKKN